MLQISVYPRLGGPIQCLSLDTLLCKLALTIVRHPHPNVQVCNCNWGGQWRQKNFYSLSLGEVPLWQCLQIRILRAS